MPIETQEVTAIERFTQSIQPQVDALLVWSSDGSAGCKITAQRDYDLAGENLAAIRKTKKRWASLLKDDPGKKPSECEGVEGVYFFAYQSLERVRKLLNDGLKWFEVRETAYNSAIADYDERKQREIERQQAKAEETGDFDKLEFLADKSQTIAKGPAGMSRQRRLKISYVNLREFVPWALRTGNLGLLKVDEGKLNKLINALAGQNIPPGVTTVRADILRTR